MKTSTRQRAKQPQHAILENVKALGLTLPPSLLPRADQVID